jgi:putative spermidine/putrescine transport system ATP-binding protein
MTVAENVAFGLRLRRLDRRTVASKVDEVLATVQLKHLADRYPAELSGGQQQRVALARAMAVAPRVLLLDEPLSALDAKIRISLREEIRSLQRALGITTIYVTHDQEEALSMSDRIVVMNEGRVEQIGAPFEIYNQPKTRFVASFVGTLSVLKGEVVDAAAGRLRVDGQDILAARALPGAAGSECMVALRPEAATLTTGGQTSPVGSLNHMTGTIEEVSFLGSVVRIRVRFKDHAVKLDTFNNSGAIPPQRGAQATVSFAREDVLILDGTA